MERSDWGNEWEHVKDVVRSLEAWVSAFERQLQSMQEQLKKWDERFDSELKWTSRIKKMGENADKIQTMAVDREQEATEESPLERRVHDLETWRDVWGSKAENYQYDVPALRDQQTTIFRRLDAIDEHLKCGRRSLEDRLKSMTDKHRDMLDERIETAGHEIVRVKRELFELRQKLLGRLQEKEFFIRIRRQQSGQPALFVDLTAGNGCSMMQDECFRDKHREVEDMVILGPFTVRCGL